MSAREHATAGARLPVGSGAVWSTREALPEDFAAEWAARLATAPLANFSLRLDYLQFEAGQGRHAFAACVDEGPRRGLLVLREAGGELHCGWPWRWQAARVATGPPAAPGMAPDDAAWWFRQAQAVAGGRRLRCHLPCEPVGGVPGFQSGATILQSLAHADEDLFAAMDANKRRLVRRAEKAGFEIVHGGSPDDWKAFAEVQRRAGPSAAGGAPSPGDPPLGQGHREWELPWMWLTVARLDGRVVAGLGDGVTPHGVVEGRAAAALEDVRREGVMSLLCQLEARALRDAGHCWLNHGGDTVFKREVAGTLGSRLSIWCWLGGGRSWSLPNHAESLALRARPRLGAWARTWRDRLNRKGRT